jgi:small-conductance mechanosensitive channel
MRKPSSSSKNVIAALVAAAFGLTAGTALAQTTHNNPGSTATSHRHASKKSVRQLTSKVKNEREQMQASTARLNRATAELKRTTRQMNEARAKEMRVASAEHKVKKGERQAQRARMHMRKTRPASTTPPPR